MIDWNNTPLSLQKICLKINGKNHLIRLLGVKMTLDGNPSSLKNDLKNSVRKAISPLLNRVIPENVFRYEVKSVLLPRVFIQTAYLISLHQVPRMVGIKMVTEGGKELETAQEHLLPPPPNDKGTYETPGDLSLDGKGGTDLL